MLPCPSRRQGYTQSHIHVTQVWLSYASFEATPSSMLGEEQEGEGSEAERRQAAAQQEGLAAAADREAHARRCLLSELLAKFWVRKARQAFCIMVSAVAISAVSAICLLLPFGSHRNSQDYPYNIPLSKHQLLYARL